MRRTTNQGKDADMRVLNSKKAFLEHYATRDPGILNILKSVGGGGVVAGGAVGASAAAAGAAAAQASAWSAFAGWPLIGSFCAGKAAAAGTAAAVAAAGSAAVLVPALLLGGGIAYAIYAKSAKSTIRKGSGVEELASSFARVACLPMMALAASVCHANPANTEPVREYVLKEMGAWGYSEAYVKAGFEEAMNHSAAEIKDHYKWAMGQLKSGSTEGIGATPEELPYETVQGFAEDFKKGFEFCIG